MAEILIPFDFSKNAIKALDQALLLSSVNNKSIELLHITNDTVAVQYPKNWKYRGDVKSIKQKLEVIIEERKQRLGIQSKVKQSIQVKESATVSGGIISRMLQGARLLVMGTHGSSGVYDKVFGTNTAVMVNHSLFPVLVIPHNWKPSIISKTLTLVKLEDLSGVSKTVKSWNRFFKTEAEAIQFTIVREAAGNYANKKSIDGIPCKLVINPIETPLADDILNYSKSLKNTMVMIFTRQKTFLEKLFLPNITYKVSGRINIPLLTLPLEGIERK